jgi:hypothetical protein
VKLNIVPARTGILWVKLGIRIFFKQPLALTGLFFMYMAAVLVLSQIPIVGPVIGAMLVPAATLGLMAATAEVEAGRFPTPTVLVSAFCAGRQRARAMLVLGIAYFVMFLAVSWLLPVEPAPGAAGTPPQLRASPALLLVAVLQLPMLIVFSLAPALVHWHEIGPVKSLFFSIVAFARNFGAYLVFAAAWCLLVAGLMLLVGVAFAVLGAAPTLATLSPILFVVAAMISASLYYTFRDSFHADEAEPAPQPTAPGGDTPS